ncbi:efflux RND transporter permease subunit [Methylosinus sp. PW1]|uniref:efflux RND transporter permease subunit n=1 Tax=Methylosinus sp. PW1 TaxID=107636 RepID=UPI001FD991ED|nr:efflux RND transporter permease subunit [Methylosinus sp. PW1]
MNFSALFIHRPVATTLLAAALFLVGAVGYAFLPVASLPAVDMPIIGVGAFRPGADSSTMAASVAAPLERRLATISGLTELTSSSSPSSTQITLQFDMNRNIDAAARDVQAALNAAATDLPADLSALPSFRKANAAASPILILALTSDTLPTTSLYDVADTVIAQRISRVPGVAEVKVAGAEQPAIRVQIDPARLATMGLGVDAVASAILSANVRSPLGAFDGATMSTTLGASDELSSPEEFRDIVLRAENGAVVKLRDVATVERGTRSRTTAGWFNGKPAVLLVITKQANANVVQVADRIKALLPELERWVPAGISIAIQSDRTVSIRASVNDVQHTLGISVALVMLVVFVFLKRATPVVAAGVTVPLSLVGTGAAMWLAGFSLDNISLMALTISVGFVVDDAIVMIENIASCSEKGMGRLEAALAGARQIGFTVIAISLSLVTVFIPLKFLDGPTGRILAEFAFTLSFAIAISTIVSLTVTPMVCAWFPGATHARPSRSGERKGFLARTEAFYLQSLRSMIAHPWLGPAAVVVSIVATIYLYGVIPKGNLPPDDTGLINATTEVSADTSFVEMARLQKVVAEIVASDPDVVTVGSSIGGSSGLTSSTNQGRMYIGLRPASERNVTTFEVIARLRRQLTEVTGMSVFLVPAQDIRVGGRQSKGQYQFTLWDSAVDELNEWTPKVVQRLRAIPEIVDVSTDRQSGALKGDIIIDRVAASRLGISISAIDAALNSYFGQRQDNLIYTQRNQYRVIMEALPARQRDPSDLSQIYVSSANGTQAPLTAVARIERGSTPLVVNHQGVVPAVTISYNIAPGHTLDAATSAVRRAADEMQLPNGLRADFSGDAADFRTVANGMAKLILLSLLCVYTILGVLYESFIHPITIISTLPSAGLGALLALRAFDIEFTVIAFIGILLLIGVVKKNGIMLVDFALQAEREKRLSREEAVLLAAKERLRPILMTTFAAMLGALPLAMATGIGAEMRRPLGVTIVGGLALSQILTLYTTPVIYLLMSRFHRKRERAFPPPGRASSPNAGAARREAPQGKKLREVDPETCSSEPNVPSFTGRSRRRRLSTSPP